MIIIQVFKKIIEYPLDREDYFKFPDWIEKEN